MGGVVEPDYCEEGDARCSNEGLLVCDGARYFVKDTFDSIDKCNEYLNQHEPVGIDATAGEPLAPYHPVCEPGEKKCAKGGYSECVDGFYFNKKFEKPLTCLEYLQEHTLEGAACINDEKVCTTKGYYVCEKGSWVQKIELMDDIGDRKEIGEEDRKLIEGVEGCKNYL